MSKLTFMQFLPELWLRDTRRLTPTAKAVWIDVIALCWNEPERGVYKRTKRAMCHEHCLDPEDLEDVLSELKSVADVVDNGEDVLIMSRRIRKLETLREYERNKKRRQRCPGGVPDMSRQSPGDVPADSGVKCKPLKTLDVAKPLDVKTKTEKEKETKEKESAETSSAHPSAKAKPERRQAKRVQFWQALVDHINASWLKRKNVPYPWDPHEFKKLHSLAIVYQAWGMMAMWDLYVEMGTYWGKLTGFMLDGLKKDVGVIVDDPRWKSKCHDYEEKLFARTGDEMVSTKEILNALVSSAKAVS